MLTPWRVWALRQQKEVHSKAGRMAGYVNMAHLINLICLVCCIRSGILTTKPQEAQEDDNVEEEGQRQRSCSLPLVSEALSFLSLTFCLSR